MIYVIRCQQTKRERGKRGNKFLINISCQLILLYLSFTCGSVQEKTLSDGDLMSLKLRELLGWVSWGRCDALRLWNPALASSSSSESSSPFFVPFLDGLYQSLARLSGVSSCGLQTQFSVDSRPPGSSLLLMLEESFVKFSWILSEDILKVFTAIWRAWRDLSQLSDLWTLSLSRREWRP